MATQLLTLVFWEFLQNLLMLCSFVAGVWFWKQQKRLISVICMALTGIGGPIFMHYTEPLIAGASALSEPALEASLINNIVVFSLTAVIFTLYMAAEWSIWTTDVLFSTIIALIMVVTQWVAASQLPWQRILFHAGALGMAFPLCTVSLRIILDKSTNLKAALYATTLVTIVISILIALIDYVPFVIIQK
ncbi:MAG: hypothetical protein GY833_18265 [Aestuariibacter sp.]|nr:hypothetical protein [Aestuariibacter sp.]